LPYSLTLKIGFFQGSCVAQFLKDLINPHFYWTLDEFFYRAAEPTYVIGSAANPYSHAAWLERLAIKAFQAMRRNFI